MYVARPRQKLETAVALTSGRVKFSLLCCVKNREVYHLIQKNESMANTPFYRVLGVWSVVLLFLIFLVIRLDKETDWFWFIIFIPLLIFDCFVIFYILLRICRHLKDGVDPNRFTVARKFWFLFMVAAKLSFIIILCCRLENIISASYYVVFIPLWIFLLGLGCDASAWVWVLANARG